MPAKFGCASSTKEQCFQWSEVKPEPALVHQVSDWCSGAAVNFGWMREAKRENTHGGL
jgi:hypothetical protein